MERRDVSSRQLSLLPRKLLVVLEPETHDDAVVYEGGDVVSAEH